jgi:hypothetical protein
MGASHSNGRGKRRRGGRRKKREKMDFYYISTRYSDKTNLSFNSSLNSGAIGLSRRSPSSILRTNVCISRTSILCFAQSSVLQAIPELCLNCCETQNPSASERFPVFESRRIPKLFSCRRSSAITGSLSLLLILIAMDVILSICTQFCTNIWL